MVLQHLFNISVHIMRAFVGEEEEEDAGPTCEFNHMPLFDFVQIKVKQTFVEQFFCGEVYFLSF